jgi:hypothetical protein
MREANREAADRRPSKELVAALVAAIDGSTDKTSSYSRS